MLLHYLACLMKIKVLLAVLLLFSFVPLQGQNMNAEVLLNGTDGLSTWHVRWTKAWESFSDRDIMHNINEVLDLDEQDSLQLTKTSTDNINIKHLRYQHFIAGKRVLGSELILHIYPDGKVELNGHVYRPTIMIPSLSESNALLIALDYMHASEYKWETQGEDSMLKIWTKNPEATYYPKSELIYVPLDLSFENSVWALCHSFSIYAAEPHEAKRVFVESISGRLWAEEELIHIIDSDAKANTRYSGQQRLVSDSLGTNSFRLREAGRGGGIETFDLGAGTKYSGAVDFTDTDNFWDNANPAQDEVGTDAHWGAEWTYDYFWNKFGRNSYDDKGATIYSYVHYGKKYNNAFWNGFAMTYGDGDSSVFTPLTSIDVCGHEIAHAVTSNSAGLIYRNESGALNESFSDIFGNAIEKYARPAKTSWKIGEDITPSGNGLRHMHNPKGRGHPDTYKGKNWRTGTADNGGVHSNSGVQNFWFYLLSEGGNGTNDNGDSYSIDSIGINKAERVAYRNLTTYLTASSDYSEARYFAIRSAEDLFGGCSDEVIAVTNAWYAVGVGNAYDSAQIVADFISDSTICHPGIPVEFVNKSTNAKSYLWQFGDGDTSTATNPTHTYGSYGKFTVKLYAAGCFFSTSDSTSKTDHITIDSTFSICDATLMTAGSWDTVYRCTGFIYDNGGEGYYQTRIRDTLTISAGPCDSMQLTFTDFDYEDKFDSLYIYDGSNTTGTLIGGFTGDSLKNGIVITAYSGFITLRQFADPFVTGRGFIAELKTFRKPLSILPIDDTVVCHLQQLQLVSSATGGYKGDYRYYWNGFLGDSVQNLSLKQDTTLYLVLEEICMKEYQYDTIFIDVKDKLELSPLPDTTVCFRQSIKFIADLTGGDTANRKVTWEPMNVVADSITYASDTSIQITVRVDDDCSAFGDSSRFWMLVKPIPVAQVGSDTIVCFDSPMNLTVKGSGGETPYTFTWDHGLGIGTVKAIRPKITDVYRVIMSDNCSGVNDTANVTVTVLDSIQLSTSADTLVCNSSLTKLRVLAIGGDSSNYTYNWTEALADRTDHDIYPIKTTTYYILVSDGCSGADALDSIFVDVLPALNITIQGTDTACYGEQVFYTTTATGGRNTSYAYQWSNGMGNNSSASTNAIVDTTFQVVLDDGCSGVLDTAKFKIHVRDPLTLTVANDTTFCNGDSILLWARGEGGIPSDYRYFWDNGGGLQASFKISPKFNTKYKVTLDDDCSSFIEDSVSVAVNTRPKISFIASPNPQCSGVDITFSNNTPGADKFKNSWLFGDGTSSSVHEPIHSYLNEGSYRVSLVVTNSFNCSDSLSHPTLIDIVPSPIADFTHIPDVATVADKYFNFTNQSKNASSYAWTFGDGFSDTTVNAYHEYSDTGYFDVTLVAKNSIGCKSIFTKTVRVKDIYLSHIPNSFTPNNDGLNEMFTPFVKGLTLYEMRIYNRWGEQVFRTEDITMGWNGLDTDGKRILAGMYLYTITGLTVDETRINEKGYVRIFY